MRSHFTKLIGAVCALASALPPATKVITNVRLLGSLIRGSWGGPW